MFARRTFEPPPGASLQIAGITAFLVVAVAALALVAPVGQRRPVVSRTEPSTWIPSSFPRFPIRKTSNNKVEYRRKSATCYDLSAHML